MAEGSPLDVIIVTKDGIWESTCSTQDELVHDAIAKLESSSLTPARHRDPGADPDVEKVSQQGGPRYTGQQNPRCLPHRSPSRQRTLAQTPGKDRKGGKSKREEEKRSAYSGAQEAEVGQRVPFTPFLAKWSKCLKERRTKGKRKERKKKKIMLLSGASSIAFMIITRKET